MDPRLVNAAVAVAAVLLPASALAQSTGELELTDGGAIRNRSRLGAELAFYGRNGHLAVAPTLHASFHAAELDPTTTLAFDVHLRTVFTDAGSPPDRSVTDLRVGNPYAGFRIGTRLGDGMRLRVGGGLAGPVMNSYSDDAGTEAVVRYSTVMTGGWDLWAVAYGYVPFVVRADFEYRGELLFAGVEGGMGVFVPVISRRANVGLSTQLGAFVGIRPTDGLALGVRGQGVYVGDSDPGAGNAFVSVIPFVRGEFEPAFIEARFVAGLAQNALTLGEPGWSVVIQAGGSV